MLPLFKVAILGGDGIGPEVVAEGVKVLRAVEALLSGVQFDLVEHSVGAGEFLRRGDPLPPSTLERIREADAILLGAMGLPSVRWPNGVEMTPQIDIREQLDLFNGIRPIRLFHETHSPLKGYGGAGGRAIDFVIIRENCEGLFSERRTPRPAGRDFETDTMTITRRGAERVCREAFKLALKRRKHCTLVDKANVLPSMAFFRKIFDEVAREFPAVTTDRVYVDAMALFLVQRPESFDVMVTENMFGDILSDEMAVICGSLGMLSSASLGAGKNSLGLPFGLYEPAGGTAPDIAGKGIANPCAQILSVALMLRFSFGLDAVATRIEAAVRAAVTGGTRTGDIAFGKPSVGTQAMADAIIRHL